MGHHHPIRLTQRITMAAGRSRPPSPSWAFVCPLAVILQLVEPVPGMGRERFADDN